MEAVIISGFLGPPDFILQPERYRFRIFYR